MDLPKDFFTIQAILTLTGAAAAVLIVTNTFRKLFKIQSPWIAAVLSMIFVYAGAYRTDALSDWVCWLLMFVNGCLLFCTTAGVQEAAVAAVAPRPAAGAPPQIRPPVKWLSSWFK